MSRRSEQVAATIRRELQGVLARGLADPRITGLVTVTAVRVTGDLKTAHVLVSVMPAERTKATLAGLRAAAAHLRHELGDAVAIRVMPRLVFEHDESVKRHAEVLAAIARASAEREGRGDAQTVGDEPRHDVAEGEGKEHRA